MAKDQATTLAALKQALQMEIDGKEYYLKAAEASTNELGKKLLARLAEEEDVHRQVFESIYEALSQKKDWPAARIPHDGGQGLKTVFSEAIRGMGRDYKAIPTEMDAIQTAMKMENETYDFYRKQAAAASYAGEKEFYEDLAAQEAEHHSALLDYFEFLKDPADWFTQKEHHSLDGG
jgi:rubrerythrin